MFNKLINTINGKEFRQYAQIAKEAKIFRLHKTIGYRVTQLSDTPLASVDITHVNEFNMDQLLLPFPIVAIAYNDFAILLKDTNKGIYEFISQFNLKHYSFGEVSIFFTGIIDLNKSQEVDMIATQVNTVYINNKQIVDRDLRHMLSNCIIPAIHGLLEINTIDRFVLEIKDTKPRIYKDKYIPLIDQRPSYVILHPKEIRKYMKTEHEMTQERRGHERRAHLRRYPDDPIKFPNAHGKIVKIPSIWVGSTEAVIGKKTYRVVLDYYITKEATY